MVADDGAAPTAPTAVVAGKAGAYLIADAPAPGNYTLRAFMDVDGNGVMDFWEPQGTWAGGIVNLTAPLDGAQITLVDPGTQDNLPYWWLVKNCGITSADQAGRKTGADWVAGWAETDFTVNIVPRSDGKVALRWKHVPNRMFQLVRADNLAEGFVVPVGDPVLSEDKTGEGENEVLDDAGNSAQYYRVKISLD